MHVTNGFIPASRNNSRFALLLAASGNGVEEAPGETECAIYNSMAASWFLNKFWECCMLETCSNSNVSFSSIELGDEFDTDGFEVLP